MPYILYIGIVFIKFDLNLKFGYTVNMDTYKTDLVKFINKNYVLNIQDIYETKRGFYGETWIIQNDKQKYFVKIDYTPFHKKTYKDSFKVIANLLAENIDFIPKVIKTTSNKYYSHFNGGILGVFEYIEGKHTENYPLEQLIEHLVKIYKVRPNKTLKRDCITLYCYKNFEKLIKKVKRVSPESKQILQILDNNRDFLNHIKDRLYLCYNVCKKQSYPNFITNGDAGGNCIIGKKFYIIDWDEAKAAPLERDLWFFMHKNEQVEIINKTFEKENFKQKLNFNLFAYYCYSSFFKYLNEYLNKYLYGLNKERVTCDISDYFSSWILTQIEFADKLIIQ